MEFNLINYTSTDNLIHHGIYFGKDFKDVAVFIPGLGGNFYKNSFLQLLQNELNKNKIGLISINTRGSHIYSIIRDTNGGYHNGGAMYEIFEDSFNDISGIINYLKEKHKRNIYLIGHSSGANKVSYALQNGVEVAKVIFASPGDDIGLQMKFLGKKKYIKMQILSKNLKNKYPFKLMPVNNLKFLPITSASYFSLYNNKSDMDQFPYRILNIKRWQKLKNLKTSALIILGSKDEYTISPVNKIKLFFEKELSNIKIKIVSNGDHNYTGKERVFARFVIDFLKG